jgi:N-acyl-D-amino-acid deacylase
MTSFRRSHVAGFRAARHLSRRWLLGAGGASLAAAATASLRMSAVTAQQSTATPTPSGTPASEATISITGQEVPELAVFDGVMSGLVSDWGVPGGQLAVTRGGRLVFDRAYGLADVEAGEPFLPESLCRIASVSKAITTVAVLALVDDGRLALDDRAFRLLAALEPPANAVRDPRLDEITIEHLLVHAGGWDDSTGVDPQQQPWTWRGAGMLGVAAPPSAEEIVRAMIGEPLDFDPGAKSIYSNFGFNVLGRVIEQVSGQPYEAFVQERILDPAGITRMQIGRTRLEERAHGEVRYYGPSGQARLPSIFPGEGYGPVAYAAFYLESLDAHGGWIASAADLLRFATAIDGQRGPSLLRPETVETMLRTPRPEVPEGAAGAGNAEPSMGLGWVVQPSSGGLDWSHAGALIGSNMAWLARLHDGVGIAFSFNSQPADGIAFLTAVIPAVQQAATAIAAWPDHDLFTIAG